MTANLQVNQRYDEVGGEQRHTRTPELNFNKTCSSLLQRLINAVPKSVKLTDEIDPLENKVREAILFTNNGSYVFQKRLRRLTANHTVTLFSKERHSQGSQCLSTGSVPSTQVDSRKSTALGKLGGLSGLATYYFTVEISWNASISKFWFEIDEKDGASPTVVDNGGSAFEIDQDLRSRASSLLWSRRTASAKQVYLDTFHPDVTDTFLTKLETITLYPDSQHPPADGYVLHRQRQCLPLQNTQQLLGEATGASALAYAAVNLPMYRVFLGAPSIADLDKDPSSYHWQTISSKSTEKHTLSATQSVVFPAATLEEASRRISLIYKNVIFDDGPDEEEHGGLDGGGVGEEQTTLITWPPTAAEDTRLTRSNQSEAPSFLFDASKSQLETQLLETQNLSESQSYFAYSDASSIARFPTFHFSLHTLASLSSLTKSSPRGPRKVTVLLAALEVEGPDTIRIKKGVEAGKEVSVMSMILGDEEGAVCKLTAWRETAEAWGATGVKRGDVLLIESKSVFPSSLVGADGEVCPRCRGYVGYGDGAHARGVAAS
ncbi:hypothetical protein LshimejAT787_1402360 [Lyophyllum shimeji]|uniref:Shieldin complex subunit 2 first OB fold domain-containing protein n=1 Tax=Lyophyllum shimeji TaxID=47721 RepID=A0A9P3PYC9_LYOSH|nr:hypothetical protein LshimejAT787_1402360 [Lyophyllum shimeji]